MKKRIVSFLLFLSLVLNLLPTAATAAGKVKLVGKSDDFAAGYYIEYEYNGAVCRSDEMGANFNYRVFQAMSNKDKLAALKVFAFSPGSLNAQFGDNTDAIREWVEEYQGWTKLKKAVQKKIAQREFGPITAYYGNVTLTNDDRFGLYTVNYDIPEVARALELKKQLDATYDQGKKISEALSEAKMEQIGVAVKALSKDLIKLIVDKALVPGISPSGMAGMGADAACELMSMADNALGLSDKLYESVQITGEGDAAQIIDDMWEIIYQNQKMADFCMEECQMLQGDLEEAMIAADEALADVGIEEEKPVRAAAKMAEPPDDQWLRDWTQRYITEQGKLQQAYNKYMSAYNSWTSLIDDGLPEFVTSQQIQSDTTTTLPVIPFKRYQDNPTTYQAINPVIYAAYEDICQNNDTYVGQRDAVIAYLNGLGAEIRGLAKDEREYSNKITYYQDKINYFTASLLSMADVDAELAFLQTVTDVTLKSPDTIRDEAKYETTTGTVIGAARKKTAQALRLLDADLNGTNEYGSDYRIVADELESYRCKAAELEDDEIVTIRDTYAKWVELFSGFYGSFGMVSKLPDGDYSISQYLEERCPKAGLSYNIEALSYSQPVMHKKMVELFEKYFGPYPYGGGGLIVNTGDEVTIQPGGEREIALEVGESASLSVLITPESAALEGAEWFIADENVAALTTNGTSATVTALRDGTATVTAIAAGGSRVWNPEKLNYDYSPQPVTFTITVGSGEEPLDVFNEIGYFRNFGDADSPKFCKTAVSGDMMTVRVDLDWSFDTRRTLAAVLYDESGRMTGIKLLDADDRTLAVSGKAAGGAAYFKLLCLDDGCLPVYVPLIAERIVLP